MKVMPHLVTEAIAKATEIKEIYQLHYIDSRETVKYIDTLKDLAERYFQKNILIKEHAISHTNHPVKGFCLSFEKDGRIDYEIVVMGGQNYCWKRLVICKELFHLLLDDEKFENKSLKKLLDAATNRLNIGNGEETELFFQVELLSEIAALEFLFPYADRELIITQSKDSGELPDYGKIAENYKIPTYFVNEYLSQGSMNSLKPFCK